MFLLSLFSHNFLGGRSGRTKSILRDRYLAIKKNEIEEEKRLNSQEPEQRERGSREGKGVRRTSREETRCNLRSWR